MSLKRKKAELKKDMVKKQVDIELEFMPAGISIMNSPDRDYNDALMEILARIVDDKEMMAIEKFLRKGESSQILIGERLWCG